MIDHRQIYSTRALKTYVLNARKGALHGLCTLFHTARKAVRTYAIPLAAPLLAGLPSSSFAAGMPEQTLRISGYRDYLEFSHPVSMGLAKFSEILSANNHGQLQLEIRSPRPGSRPAQQISALRRTTLQKGDPQIMLQATTGLVDLVDEFGLLDLPFVIRNERQADALLDGPFGAKLLATLPEQGLVGLAYWENGFRHMTSSKAPITSADDFKGLKMRVIPSPMFTQPFETIGAQTLAMPFASLYQALATKTVNAQDNYYSQIVAGKLHQVQGYLSETHHSYSALIVLINKGVWDQLTPTEQRILRDAAIEAGNYQRHLNRQANRAARVRLKSLGMMINTVPAAELNRLQSLTEPVTERLTRDYDPSIKKLFEDELRKAD